MRAMIKDMYTGQISNWPAANGEPALTVHPWVLPAQDETQAFFETTLLGGDQIVKTAMIAPSPAAMLEAIAEDPQAIGFLPMRTLDSSVKSIEILNFSPSGFNHAHSGGHKVGAGWAGPRLVAVRPGTDQSKLKNTGRNFISPCISASKWWRILADN